MFLTFINDCSIRVHDSPAEAVVDIEGLDVEKCVWAAYDSEGQAYRVRWIEPNTEGRSFGLIPWVKSGIYEWVPAGEKAPLELLRWIQSAESIRPANREQDIRLLQWRLGR